MTSPHEVPLTVDTETQPKILRPWCTFQEHNTVEIQNTHTTMDRLEHGSRALGGWLKDGISMSLNISLTGIKHLKQFKEAYIDQDHPTQTPQAFDGKSIEGSVKNTFVAPPPQDLEYVLVYKPRAPNRLQRSVDSEVPGPYNLLASQHTPLLPPPSISRRSSAGSIMSQVIPYPQHKVYPRSGNYTVSVNGIPLDVVSLTSYDYVHFALPPMDSVGVFAEVVISLISGKNISKYRLSPRKKEFPHAFAGNKLHFNMYSHAYAIIQLNDHREILILCDPAETDVPPPSGSGVYNVLERGADNKGTSYATSAFQNALHAASVSITPDPLTHQVKQAIVYVPAGLYLLENIVLPSNTALYLEPGAVLRFSGIAKDYNIHWHKNSQNRNMTWWISTAFNSSNIRIYGRGTIDGNGWTSTNRSTPRIGNNILVPIACQGFRLEGIIVRDSGSWSVTPIRSSDISVHQVKMLNRLDMGENDCIDPMECQRVKITKCIGVSLDDPFSTKTWAPDTDIAQSWPGKPQAQSDILFEDCMSWTRCFGFKVGQGAIQPQRNITFRDCVVYDAAIGLGINHRYGRAPIEDILFERCEIERVSLTLVNRRTWFACFTEMGSPSLGVGPTRRVKIEGCKVWDRGKTRVEMVGFGGVEGLVSEVMFRNIEMKDLITPDQPDGRARDLVEIGIDESHVKWVKNLEVVVDF